MSDGRVVAYLEDYPMIPEPDGMGYKCPICRVEPGIWCTLSHVVGGRNIGFLHIERVELAEKAQNQKV